jgi:hypothetical protein
MSGSNIRVIDLPDLGAVTDASSFVIDKAAATGRFSALALKTYCTTTTLPEAPSNNTPYGRMNGGWTPVLGEAPSNGLPYARLNAAWSPVVPEAPLTASIYGRGGAGWTPVLPITGGTINGGLTVTSDIHTGGAVFANEFALSSANGYAWNFTVDGGTGNHRQEHTPGWYDSWHLADGLREWTRPGLSLMTLDASANLTVVGNLVGGLGVWQTLNVFGFTLGGQGRKFLFATNHYWEWNQVTTGTLAGQLTYVANGTPMWNMRPSDGMCFNSVAAVGGVGPYVNNSDRRGKTGITPTPKGLAEVLQLQPVAFSRADPTTGAQEEIGFVAQDVQPILPEAVWQLGIPLKDGSGGLDSAEPTLAISEATISAISVNAIKELNSIITALTARIAALENPA